MAISTEIRKSIETVNNLPASKNEDISYEAIDRAIGDAFDAVKQALGQPGRAFYYYA